MEKNGLEVHFLHLFVLIRCGDNEGSLGLRFASFFVFEISFVGEEEVGRQSSPIILISF